tara:strand:- start:2062 stop:2532 length:471 start_codon:yes stop_codon:yes gene_type:complete
MLKDREEYLEYHREYNRRNKERKRKVMDENKFNYIMEKCGGKCQICKERFPIEVFDFHHIDPSQKKFNVSNGRLYGMTKLTLEELEKCAILCCNCHRLEHVALKRGETLINDPDAYLRYRNHRFTKQPNLFDREDMDDRDDGHGDEDEEEFPCAFI